MAKTPLEVCWTVEDYLQFYGGWPRQLEGTVPPIYQPSGVTIPAEILLQIKAAIEGAQG